MTNRTSWIYLIVSISILAFPPWMHWYANNTPLTHAWIHGKYTAVSSSQDVMLRNVFYALAALSASMLVISWLKFECINLGKYIYLSNASCIGYLGWSAWILWF